MRSDVAVVTGGSRGIGLATVERLLEDGYRVVATGRKEESLEAAAERLGAGDQLLTIAGHSADPDHRREAAALTLERFGRIDVLVSNVGINPVLAPLANIDLSVVTKVFDTNVVAALGWVQEVHRGWMRERGGRIITISSAAGLRTVLNTGAYAISKAALIHMTRQLAAELGPAIRVNSVAPAVVITPMNAKHNAGREGELAARYPLGRLGEVADVASAVAYLASADADWVSGETLVVDGGLLAAGGILE